MSIWMYAQWRLVGFRSTKKESNRLTTTHKSILFIQNWIWVGKCLKIIFLLSSEWCKLLPEMRSGSYNAIKSLICLWIVFYKLPFVPLGFPFTRLKEGRDLSLDIRLYCYIMTRRESRLKSQNLFLCFTLLT